MNSESLVTPRPRRRAWSFSAKFLVSSLFRTTKASRLIPRDSSARRFLVVASKNFRLTSRLYEILLLLLLLCREFKSLRSATFLSFFFSHTFAYFHQNFSTIPSDSSSSYRRSILSLFQREFLSSLSAKTKTRSLPTRARRTRFY